jgi:hypothetical protein
MTAPAIAEQVARMRDLYPAMRVAGQCDWLVSWLGPLQPLQRTYIIDVLYIRRYWIADMEVINGYTPCVRLVKPRLIEQHPVTRKFTPHVYWRLDDPEASSLCLYDPASSEWSKDDLVADTAMPWVSDWLACYEGWLATGEWTGGGRHPPPRAEETQCAVLGNQAIVPNRDQRELELRAAFHFIGRKIGTFASWPLMAAASVGSSRPLSWRDWNSDTLTAPRLPAIST